MEAAKERFPRLFGEKGDDWQEDSEVILLGSGTSAGMPRVGCLLKRPTECDVCVDALSPGSKNKRKNPSMLIRYKKQYNILIDCGKTFRESMIQLISTTGITHIDALLITHEHADAILGLDDLREFTDEKSVPVYVSKQAYATIERMFPYLVNTDKATGSGYVSKIEWKIFDRDTTFDIYGLRFTPLLLEHGPGCFCLGYIFGQVAYLSDLVGVPPETEQLIRDTLGVDEEGRLRMDVLFIDALLLHNTNGSHWNLIQTMEQVQKWMPKKTFFVGMGHEFDYRTTNNELQKLKLTYDPSQEPPKEKKDKSWKAGKSAEELAEAKKKKKRTIESVLRKNVDRKKLVDVEMGFDMLHYIVDLP